MAPARDRLSRVTKSVHEEFCRFYRGAMSTKRIHTAADQAPDSSRQSADDGCRAGAGAEENMLALPVAYFLSISPFCSARGVSGLFAKEGQIEPFARSKPDHMSGMVGKLILGHCMGEDGEMVAI